MEDLKPNGQRAKNAIILIGIVLVLELISLISAYFQYDLLQNTINGEELLTETANANDLRQRIIAVIYFIAFIISGVTFIQWFRRAYFNLHQKTDCLSYSEGWAAGSWFVPIVSLYRPYQIMKDLYNETEELLSEKQIEVTNYSTKYLGIWWTLWVINSFVGQIVSRYSIKAVTLDELTTSTLGSMGSNIIGIPLAFITIKVIIDYTELEALLHGIKMDEEITPNIDFAYSE
jgi:hypothetical protein